MERDDKVRLTLVWFMCVEPLTTGTALLLCVFESSVTRWGSVYTILCSPHLLHRGMPRGYIEHVMQ